jgi:hypothetical protein
MLTVVGVGLALAKLTSLHGFAKTDVSPLVTLLGGLAVTAVALGVLSRTGRRWAVPGARAVVVALAVYAAAALGLDVVTGVVEVVRGGGGPVTDAAATFVEEFGEALAALLVLGTVRAKAALAR